LTVEPYFAIAMYTNRFPTLDRSTRCPDYSTRCPNCSNWFNL